MVRPGQFARVRLFDSGERVGLVIDADENEATIDFQVIGGVFRLTVPQRWCIVYVPNDEGVIQ